VDVVITMHTTRCVIAVVLLVGVDSSCNRSSPDVQVESELREDSRVVAVIEEGGQDKRRQRICRVKSLSARWLAQRRVERRLRWSMNYAVDHTLFIVRFTRVSTPNLDEVAQ